MRLTRLHAMFVAMCVIWGATWIPMKIGLGAVPPALFAGTRFTMAGLVLVGFLAWRGETMRVRAADLPRLGLVAALMIVATYTLVYWGAALVSSGLAAILDLAFIPVALLGISALLGEDRFTPARAGGVAVGVCGLLLLFGPKALAVHGVGGRLELAGGAAIVVGALTYSLGSVLSRPLLRRYSPSFISGVSTLAGGVVLLAGAVVFEPGAVAVVHHGVGWRVWASWWFLVLFGSLVAAIIFLELLHRWGPSRASAYAFVSPIIAVGLGVAVLGEAVTVWDGVGMVTMLVGAWLTLRPV